MLKTEGDILMVVEGNLISHSHMDEVMRPIVLPFLGKNQCQFQALDANAKSHLTRSNKISFVKTMLRALTGQCAHQTCLQLNMCMIFLDIARVLRNILTPRNLQSLDAALQEE